LIDPLRIWHQRLGLPDVKIIDVNGKTTAQVSPLRSSILEVSDAVYEAYYRYDEAMLHFIANEKNQDLHGNLSRLPEKALRVAALLASLADSSKIEIPHWARGQIIAEHWREGLYAMYDQVRSFRGNHHLSNEQKVLRVIDTKENVTGRMIAQYAHLTTEVVKKILEGLLENGEIQEVKQGRTKIFVRS
jgi:hypothetical protein